MYFWWTGFMIWFFPQYLSGSGPVSVLVLRVYSSIPSFIRDTSSIFSLPIQSAGKGGTLGERGSFCGATHLRLSSWVFGSGSILFFMIFYSLPFPYSADLIWLFDHSIFL